jgi:hypothetical protein
MTSKLRKINHQCIRFLKKLDYKLRLFEEDSVSQVRKVRFEELNRDTLDFVNPFFVLSTGRCGTLWLTKLLRSSAYVYVNHADRPQLIRHSKLAYEQYEQSPHIFCEIIRAARDEIIVEAYKHGKIYIETNNRVTFFAYAIKHVYPNAKFIHLIRHPGDFVRSGLSRGWYNGHSHDLGRIVKSGEIRDTMSDIEKIAWLWNETNRYVEDFFLEINKQDYIQIKAEDMFNCPSVSEKLCQFIGIDDITSMTIAKMLNRQINQQNRWSIRPYQTWSEGQKAQVIKWATLASRYEYGL